MDESQKSAAQCGACLLGHQSSHQRALSLTTLPDTWQPRIIAAVRTRGTTIAGLGREGVAGLASRDEQGAAG